MQEARRVDRDSGMKVRRHARPAYEDAVGAAFGPARGGTVRRSARMAPGCHARYGGSRPSAGIEVDSVNRRLKRLDGRPERA